MEIQQISSTIRCKIKNFFLLILVQPILFQKFKQLAPKVGLTFDIVKGRKQSESADPQTDEPN